MILERLLDVPIAYTVQKKAYGMRQFPSAGFGFHRHCQSFHVPAYLKPSGWVGMRLDRDLDWEDVDRLLMEGYRMVAPKRAIAALDSN